MTYAGVVEHPGLQAAFGRFPGTGFPAISAGVTLTPGAATVGVTVPVADMGSGAADGSYVAILAAGGRPVRTARFTIDCGP